MRSRSISLTLLAAAAAMTTWATSKAQPKSDGRITNVIELYTSQGCSSCPPADKLFGTYAGRDDILALSFSVDIWDNLGWKDTLAKPQFTQRQRAYAQSRGDGNVYTPQAVVNGVRHTTGSDKSSVDALLRGLAFPKQELRADVSVTIEPAGALIETTMAPAAKSQLSDVTVWLAKLTPKIDVEIMRGENARKSVTYHNVVREFRAVGTLKGSASPLRIAREALAGCKPATCAVIVQQAQTGPILGAAWLPADSRL